MTDVTTTVTQSESEFSAQDAAVCKTVFAILQRAYPDHPWSIAVDHRAGTIIIDLMYYKPRKYHNFAYRLFLSTLLQANNEKRIVQAGGELLERFNIPRDAASPEARMRLALGGEVFDVSNADFK